MVAIAVFSLSQQGFYVRLIGVVVRSDTAQVAWGRCGLPKKPPRFSACGVSHLAGVAPIIQDIAQGRVCFWRSACHPPNVSPRFGRQRETFALLLLYFVGFVGRLVPLDTSA